MSNPIHRLCIYPIILLLLAAVPRLSAGTLPEHELDDLLGQWEGVLVSPGAGHPSWSMKITIRATEQTPEEAKGERELTDEDKEKQERIRMLRERREQLRTTGTVEQPKDTDEEPGAGSHGKQDQLDDARGRMAEEARRAREGLEQERDHRQLVRAAGGDADHADRLAVFYGSVEFVAHQFGGRRGAKVSSDAIERTRGEWSLVGTLDPVTGRITIRHGMEVLRAPDAESFPEWLLEGFLAPDEPALFGWADSKSAAPAPFLLRPQGSLDHSFYAKFDPALSEQGLFEQDMRALSNEVQARYSEIRERENELKQQLDEDPSGDSLDIPPAETSDRRGRARGRDRGDDQPQTEREQRRAQERRISQWASDQRTQLREEEQRRTQEIRDRYDSIDDRGRQVEPELSIELDADRMTNWVRRLADEDPGIEEREVYWMNTLGGMVTALLADPYFTEAFGKPYEELNDADRTTLRWVLERRKHPNAADYVELPEPLFGRGVGPLQHAFDERRYHYYIALTMVDRHLRAWREHLLGTIDSLNAELGVFPYMLNMEALSARFLRSMMLSEQDEVSLALFDARDRLGDDIALLRAQDLADNSSDASAFVRLTRFWDLQGDLAGFVSDTGRQRANQVLDERIDELVEVVLAQMRPEFDAIGTGVDAVYDGARWHRKLVMQMGPAWDRPAVQAASRKLRQRRPGDLRNAQAEIMETIAAMDDTKRLRALPGAVLSVPGDAETEAGRAIRDAVLQRLAALDLEAFLALFSERERELMPKDRPGLVSVPSGRYSAPTSEEVRLATLRELASTLSGEVIDPHSADIGAPGFEALFPDAIWRMRISDIQILGVERAADGGWNVHYIITSSLEPRGIVAELFNSDVPAAQLGRALISISENMADDLHHRFELTPQGWRSPTMRVSILTGAQFTNSRLEPNDDDLP